MKQQIHKAKTRLTRVELTPFPVWKKWYFILMASVGMTWLTYKALSLILGIE